MILIISLLSIGALYSQEERTEFCIYFRPGTDTLDSTFVDNARTLNELKNFLQNTSLDKTIQIVNATFTGGSSPEGSDELNHRMAQSRMMELEKFVRSNISIDDSIVTLSNYHILWDYLREEIEKSDLQHKQEALRVLDEKPRFLDFYVTDRTIDHRVVKLQHINGGATWREIYNRFCPNMRNATVKIITYKDPLKEIVVKTDSINANPIITRQSVATADYAKGITKIVINNGKVSKKSKSKESRDNIEPSNKEPQVIYIAVHDDIYAYEINNEENIWLRKLNLKTNALTWLAGISNAAFEIDIAQHWSFNLPIYYSAWNYFSQTIKMRAFAIQPEFRYWINRYNNGLFIGAHFSMLSYNLAMNGDYRYQDRNGKNPALGGGLSVGYRMPISRNNRWKVEFSLGVGGYPLDYDVYYNTPNTKDGIWVRSQQKTYWGIDQASVSFSYTFNMRNKGGAR